MRLVDELKIKVCAGKGGDGIVSWLRLKNMPKGGPAGGDGGKGGDVYVKAVPDIEALRRYAGIKELKAGDGKPGRSRSQHGEDGKDLILEFPVGSVVKFNDKEIHLLDIGKPILILKGGKGGLGNKNFKSSVNQAPKKATKGKEGECAELFVELQVIADIGLVGKPNAGKSSLLNALTNSKVKTADYPFTTLEPNLAVFDGIVLADIPGLIEGAHTGKGLGIKFLKHIKRTKALLHLISLENENLFETYSVIRDELASYDKELIDKPELVVFTKADLFDEQTINNKIEGFLAQAGSIDHIVISLSYPDTVERLKQKIKELYRKTQN